MSIKEWKKRFYGMPGGKRYAKILKHNEALILQTELYYKHWKNHGDDEFFTDQMEYLIERANMNEQYKVCADVNCCGCAYLKAQTLACTPSPGSMFSDAVQVLTQGNYPMNKYPTTATGSVAIAAIETKTDLQTQRDYLLNRWSEVNSSFQNGKIRSKMTEVFNLYVSNKPKTSKELVDGITSGKYTLDATKAALQEIGTAREDFYDEDDNYTGTPFYAMNWGGLDPDRLGYEKARDSFSNSLKLLKDQIMTGDPAASATALQALEAWTPPTAAVAAPN